MRLWPRTPTLSLRLRIALTILCLGTVLLGGVLLVTLRHSLDTAKSELAAVDRDTSVLLQDLGRIALLTDEFGNLQSFIETLDERSRIRSVAVIDLSGRIMASSEPAEIGTRPEATAADGPDAALQTIANGTYRLGSLRVVYSDAGLERAYRRAYRLGLTIGAVGILVIALVGWWVGHLLTRRLAGLAAVADAVSGGDLTRRAQLSGRDEVARVGRAFDDMVERIERRLETIRLDRDRLILPTEAINEGFILWDAQERLVRCNRRCRELLGPAGQSIELGMSYEAFLAGPVAAVVAGDPADWPERMAGMLARHRQGGCLNETELRDGRWLRVSKSRLPDGSMIGIYTDITEAKTRELALEASEGQLRAIMNSVDEGIIVLDAAARVQVANPAAATMFGRDVAAMTGRHVDELLAPSDELPAAPAPGQRAEMVGIRGDGARFPAEVAMGLLCRSGGVRIVTVRDVTQQKADRDHILLQATHDELTGLPNRRLFDDRLEMTLRRAARSGELVAVAFLDVDGFKTVNDSLGHAMGDRLLVALSRRLQACLRDSDTVVRMGGDEFIFILPGLQRPEDVLHPVRKLLEAVRQPLRLDGQELSVTASIGVAVYPGDGQDRDHLLRHADAALYRAKARGRNRFEHYDPTLAGETAARVRLDSELRRAGGRDELSLAYQPQINFRTGRVVGFEALMRWDHPQLGLVSPGTFIPIAEESGQIAALGLWALDRACRDMTAWDRCGLGPLRIAVNVSLRQLQQDELVAQVERVLAETGLAAARLELEFTEAALLAEDAVIGRNIGRLHRLGVGLALDDFGTGCSSLGHLRRYPIQRLKMDPSTVRGIARDRTDAAVARAIVGLARDLRLGVVAEGVETHEQLTLLGSFGCEEAQGFLLGRPMPAQDVAGSLRLAA